MRIPALGVSIITTRRLDDLVEQIEDLNGLVAVLARQAEHADALVDDLRWQLAAALRDASGLTCGATYDRRTPGGCGIIGRPVIARAVIRCDCGQAIHQHVCGPLCATHLRMVVGTPLCVPAGHIQTVIVEPLPGHEHDVRRLIDHDQHAVLASGPLTTHG